MLRKSALATLGVSVVASLAIGLPATPANAVACKAGQSGSLNSGVSKSTYKIRADRCTGSGSISMTVADTKADKRAAEVVAYFYKKTTSSSWDDYGIIKADGGKGDTASTQFYYDSKKYRKVVIETRACNFWGCSSAAWTTFKW